MGGSSNYEYLYRVTTRKRRPTDEQEGVLPVSMDEFNANRQNLISVHAPFNDDRLYGWYVDGAEYKLNNGTNLITDPNVEHLGGFLEHFGRNMHLIGLTADPEYVQYNLEERVRREKGGISHADAVDIQGRVYKGIEYSSKLIAAYNSGLIDEHIAVDWNNRNDIIRIVEGSIAQTGGQMNEGWIYNEVRSGRNSHVYRS